MEFGACLLGREGEVGADGGGADSPFRVAEFRFDGSDVSFHLAEAGAETECAAFRADRVAVACFHFDRHAARLEFAHDHPSADFVQQNTLNAAMERVEPALKFRARLPNGNDVVAVFKKLHFHTERIVGRTTEAVVAGKRNVGVNDFFHGTGLERSGGNRREVFSEFPNHRHEDDGDDEGENVHRQSNFDEVRKAIVPDALHDEIGLIANRRGETGGGSHADGDEEGCGAHAEVLRDGEAERESQSRCRVVGHEFREKICHDEDHGEQDDRTVALAQSDGKFCHGIGESGVLHGAADGEGAGNRDEDVPGDELSVFSSGEHVQPRHDDGDNGCTNEHVDFDAGEGFADGGQFADGRAENHERRQDDGEDSFLRAECRLRVFSVGDHEEERGVSPVCHEVFIGKQFQRVTLFETLAAHVVHDEGFAASLQCQDDGTIFSFEVKINDSLVDGREACAEHDLHAVHALCRRIAWREVPLFSLVGQEKVGEEPKIKKPEEGNDDSHLAKFKHREPFKAGVNDHAVDDEVRACADERANAAENRGVGKRNEQFCRCHPVLLRPALNHRGEDDHDRRVVEKGGDEGDGGQHSGLHFSHSHVLALRQQLPEQDFKPAGTTNAFADEEEQCHRNHSFVGKTFQHLLRRDDADTHENHCAGEKNQSGAHAVFDEREHEKCKND